MAKGTNMKIGDVFEESLDRHDLGITNDPHDTTPGNHRMITNFDIFSQPHILNPYRSSENGDTSASTDQIQNICIAQGKDNVGANLAYRLWGLGVRASPNQAKAAIYYKGLTASGSDLIDGTWTLGANAQSAGGSADFRLFVPYAKTGLIYGAEGGNNIFSFDPTGATSFNNASHSLTYTNITQGVVHSADDVLYIPYDNKIASNNNGSWTDAALTLDSRYFITSICEYGSNLAIALVPLSGIGNSRVVIWDRDSSVSGVLNNYEWGTGTLMVLDVVDGILVGISQQGGKASSFGTVPSGTTSQQDKVFFRYLNGNAVETFKTLWGGANDGNGNHAGTTVLPIAKQRVNNRLYFMMSIYFDGLLREGVWSIGRTPGNPFAIVHERTLNNDTVVASSVLKNFFYVDDYLFQVYTTSGTFAMTKTDDQVAFSHTSYLESKIMGVDHSFNKQLVGVALQYDPLLSGQSVTVKYQSESNVGSSTWTTIFTRSTVGENTYATSKIEGGGMLPAYHEIRFRIESTGGAVVNEFTAKSQVIKSKPYG